MLHIILLILKIIGIILLCILGILFFAVLSALFVPVRYRIEITREEGEDKPPVLAYVKVTWFLHIINVLVAFPSDVFLRVRIMLFTVFRLPKKEGKNKKKERKAHRREKEKSKEDAQEPSGLKEQEMQVLLEESGGEEQTASKTEEAFLDGYAKKQEEYWDTKEHGTDTDTEDEAGEKEGAESTRKFSLNGKIRGIIDKIKRFAIKIKKIFENIRYTIREFCDKIKSTLDNIEYYRDVLESETFRQSFQLCKKEFSYIGKKLKPDKFEADFVIGMEDPAALGEVLAVWGMLYPLIGRHVRLSGDFGCGRMRIEGSLYIQGKIRAFTFLRLAVRIYFNKNIRKLIKLLKKEAA